VVGLGDDERSTTIPACRHQFRF